MRAKKFELFLLSLLVLLFALCEDALTNPDKSIGTSSKIKSAQDRIGRPLSYPRLYFTQAKLKELRKKISDDAVVSQAWEDMLKRADRLVNEKLVSRQYSESGTGQHGNYGRPSSQISNMGTTLGFAYQMTGKSEYAEKLREALLHYGSLNRWAGDAKRDPPWNSELNTARFCFGYAVGYDSIHDFLSESDRKTIIQTMVKRGILPTLNDWILPEKRILFQKYGL